MQDAQPHNPHTGSILTRPLAKGVVVVFFAGIGGLLFWAWGTIRIGVVISDSMVPTLMRGDVYTIRVDAYREHPPERGDIVVVKRVDNGQELVKRVIAVGGDWVGVAFGRAWVNGQQIEEPYIDRVPGVREWPVQGLVGKDQLFVLGDNRNFSEDSRDIGTLPLENVMGRAEAIIYPFDRRHRLVHPDLHVPPPPTLTGSPVRPEGG